MESWQEHQEPPAGLIGAKTPKAQPDDNVFAGGRISDASAYLKDYPGLQWPHGVPAATTAPGHGRTYTAIPTRHYWI